MKPNKRKLSVVLSEEVVRTLDDYAMLMNLSRSRILDEILLQALPSMKPLVEAMAAIKSGAVTADVDRLIEQHLNATKDLIDYIIHEE